MTEDNAIPWPEMPEFDEDEFETVSLPDNPNWPEGHRSGFIAVVGRPNVGKSTLMNAYLGQKIAIVSPKAQTTRNRLMGILTQPDAQLIFIDTPGIHQPAHKLGHYLVNVARRAIPDADVILWMVDGSESPAAEDRLVVEAIASARSDAPLILVMNKADLLAREAVQARLNEFTALYRPDVAMAVSARSGYNRDALLDTIIQFLPDGPRYYPEDQVTDLQTRFIAAEMVREAALELLRHEIPHSLAVVVDEFKHRQNEMIYISAWVYVERESQKGIVIGQGGKTLKKIGLAARSQIEEMVEAKVFLDLRVKVRPQWRSNKDELKRLGYSLDE